MAELVRHRQPKGPATDRPAYLTAPPLDSTTFSTASARVIRPDHGLFSKLHSVGRCEEVPAIPGGVDESAWSKCTRDRSGHPPGAPQRDEVQPGYPGVTGYAWRLIGLVVTEIIGIDSYQEQSLPMRPVFEDGASDFCAVMDTEQG